MKVAWLYPSVFTYIEEDLLWIESVLPTTIFDVLKSTQIYINGQNRVTKIISFTSKKLLQKNFSQEAGVSQRKTNDPK